MTGPGRDERRRRYLVVGGRSGIGAAIVARLLTDGGACVATSRDPAADAEAHEDHRQVRLDVRDDGAITRAVRTAAGAMGGIDGVVYCAGTAAVGPFADLTVDDIDDVLAVNVRGFLLVVRDALPHLRRSPDSCVVVLSSQAAARGQALISAYSASKGALESLVRALAVELAGQVRVNGVAPGIVVTDMIREDFRRQSALRGEPESVVADRVRDRIPQARFQSPESIAGAVAYLLSDDGRDVTGQILHVDGGMTA